MFRLNDTGYQETDDNSGFTAGSPCILNLMGSSSESRDDEFDSVPG